MIKHNRIMFHGTNSTYHDRQIKEYDRYEHGPGSAPVQLTHVFDYACLCARVKCEEFNTHDPVVLVVDTSKLTGRVRPIRSHWRVDFLDKKAYRKIELNHEFETDLNIIINNMLNE